jgi:hypothetical protein
MKIFKSLFPIKYYIIYIYIYKLKFTYNIYSKKVLANQRVNQTITNIIQPLPFDMKAKISKTLFKDHLILQTLFLLILIFSLFTFNFERNTWNLLPLKDIILQPNYFIINSLSFLSIVVPVMNF